MLGCLEIEAEISTLNTGILRPKYICYRIRTRLAPLCPHSSCFRRHPPPDGSESALPGGFLPDRALPGQGTAASFPVWVIASCVLVFRFLLTGQFSAMSMVSAFWDDSCNLDAELNWSVYITRIRIMSRWVHWIFIISEIYSSDCSKAFPYSQPKPPLQPQPPNDP